MLRFLICVLSVFHPWLISFYPVQTFCFFARREEFQTAKTNKEKIEQEKTEETEKGLRMDLCSLCFLLFKFLAFEFKTALWKSVDCG